jgi:hypothetical protein
MENLEGASSTLDYERWMKEAVGMECYCLKGLSVEGLWGGYFTGDPGRYVKKGFGYGHLSP